MGFFDFFKSKPVNDQDSSAEALDQQEAADKIIDRNLFVKDSDTGISLNSATETSLQRVFSRIRKDYETEGYNDALSTADNKYRNDNLEILKLDLEADIQEAEIDIREYLKEVEFHISSRRKAELFDLVEELESKKEVCLERLATMKEIKDGMANNTGTSRRMELAYIRGFNKGLAALTMADVINKKI